MSPTITEIVYALKEQNSLVGVSQFCSYPVSACDKPQVGTALTPEIEKILGLNPDYILSQNMQTSPLDQQAAKLKLKVMNFDFNSFIDVLTSIEAIGTTLETNEGKKLSNNLKKKFQKLTGLKAKGSYLAIIDVIAKMGRINSLLVATNGTFYSDILNQAGLSNKAQATSGSYIKLSLEDLITMKPEYLFFFSPKENENSSLVKKELVKFSLTSETHKFEADYAVIPGPRLGILIDEIVASMTANKAL